MHLPLWYHDKKYLSIYFTMPYNNGRNIKMEEGTKKMKYRLGIDLGSTSIGWAIAQIDEHKNPIAMVDMGVRIFPDGREDKSKSL